MIAHQFFIQKSSQQSFTYYVNLFKGMVYKCCQSVDTSISGNGCKYRQGNSI